ncbi:S8 family serine peptidase [Mycolicibacterium sp. 624]|uniref:S8 family peptidase n=1 Tax=Mycolicibacterium sp. 624 TaxID=3156314 RepID=UPI0033924E54
MPEERETFREFPGSNRLVQFQPGVNQPMADFGELIAPNTLLVPNEISNVANEAVVSDVFDNVRIEFELDPPDADGAGGGDVENSDNWGIGLNGLDAARFWEQGFRGQRVRIGIADSGLDTAHPAFASLKAEERLVGFAHFDEDGRKQVQQEPDGSQLDDAQAVPTFGHWHGTHCAGILVGEPTEGRARGMAPAAELAVCRVLEESNTGTLAQINAGLWWLTKQACDVVSLSLGRPGLLEVWSAPIQALLDAGVVVVAAVGNEFGIAGKPKSRSPANYLMTPSEAPAGILIVVGAHDEAGDVWDRSSGEVVDWSQVKVEQTDGSMRPSIFAEIPPRIVPTVVAPGVNIISPIPDGLYLSSPGSSMATPHIAGLLALILSGLRTRDPAARPRTAADFLLANLADLPPAGTDIRSGGGRVDLDRLLAAILP